jgi:hypothetical protein
VTVLIDKWLHEYQVSSRYSVLVHASDDRVYGALKLANFSNLAIVRILMRLRGYKLDRGKTAELDTAKNERFLELERIPNREVVLGITGRFWRFDGGIVRGLTPETFADFHCHGCAKAVWSFSLAPSNGDTEVTTETRVQTFGSAATLKFRAYWAVIGPFSGLIRRAMLREVKRIAELRGA